jgi:hypothetical protein
MCRRCGHEWFRANGLQWLCARCEWPPKPKATAATAASMRADLLAWVDSEIAQRDAPGSYAKGQRVMLTRFREKILQFGHRTLAERRETQAMSTLKGGVLTERDREVLYQLPKDEFVRPMDVGGTNGSHHSQTLCRLARLGLVEQKRHYKGVSGGHWRYRRLDMVQQAIDHVRVLAGYGCAGIDQEPDDTALCGKCGPCEAGAFLKLWGFIEHP